MAGTSIASHMSEYASGWLPRIGVAASMTIPPMMGPMSIPRSSPVKAVLLAAPRRDGGTEANAADWSSGPQHPNPAEPRIAAMMNATRLSATASAT